MSDDPPRSEPKRVVFIAESDGPEIDLTALLADGWRYQDVPWVEAKDWDYLMAALGERGVDYHILARTISPSQTTRGQIVFSPNAVKNMITYRDLHPAPGRRLDA